LIANPPMLNVETLTADRFAPFGEVLAFDESLARRVNDGQALRADTPARLAGSGSGKPVLAYYRSEAQALPLSLSVLERHPLSSQAFVAVTVERFLVVVAPAAADGLPDLAAACAFVGRTGQGVNYRAGIWHAPITALDRSGDFLMMMWEVGGAEDCIEYRARHLVTVASPR
jgi:ureidoglycolate lyase